MNHIHNYTQNQIVTNEKTMHFHQNKSVTLTICFRFVSKFIR